MRTDLKVAALSLAALLGACDSRPERTAALTSDMEKDLAAASLAGTLAPAPQSYQRMRFVSAIEQPRESAPVRRAAASPRRPRTPPRPVAQPAADIAPEPVAEATEVASSESPAPMLDAAVTASVPAPEVIVARGEGESPARDPVIIPVGTTSDQIEQRGRGRGVGLGGVLGGIIGAVVIRGGHGGRDKCDPRTDGRNRPVAVSRPDFGMPPPTGGIFGGGRR